MQTTLGLSATPVFTGNITFPTLSVAPTGTQLGYTYNNQGAGQTNLASLAKTNLVYASLSPGVYSITGRCIFKHQKQGLLFLKLQRLFLRLLKLTTPNRLGS